MTGTLDCCAAEILPILFAMVDDDIIEFAEDILSHYRTYCDLSKSPSFMSAVFSPQLSTSKITIHLPLTIYINGCSDGMVLVLLVGASLPVSGHKLSVSSPPVSCFASFIQSVMLNFSVLQKSASANLSTRRLATLVLQCLPGTRNHHGYIESAHKTGPFVCPPRTTPPCGRNLPFYRVMVRFQHDERGAAATAAQQQEAQTTPKRPSTAGVSPHDQEQLDRLERALHDAADHYQQTVENDDESSVQREALMKVRDAYHDLQYWDEALKVEVVCLERYGGSTLDRAASLHRQGKLHMRLQESVKANLRYREALDLYKSEYNAVGSVSEIGRVLISMAAVQYHREHFQESLDLLNQAEVHFSDLPDMSVRFQHQGLVYRAMENFDKALESYERAFQLLEQMHSLTDLCSAPEEVFNQCQGLRLDMADMLSANDRAQEALDLYQDILEQDNEFKRRHKDQNPNAALEGILKHNIGKLRAQLGQHEAAVDDLTRAIELKASLLGDTNPEMAKTWNALGAVHAVLGNQSQALDCFQQFLLICRMHYEESDPQVMLALRNIAVLKGQKITKWGADDEGPHS